MEVYIIGTGRRLAEIAAAFSPRGDAALVLTPDEPTYRLCMERHIPVRSVEITSADLRGVGVDPHRDDIIVVSDHDEVRLRATLDNLSAQGLPGQVLVLAPESTRELEGVFPSFVFKSSQSVYRDELREFVRRHQTVQRVNAIRDIVRESRRLLTVVWGNPDPDAIASAVALGELVRQDVEGSEIVYTGEFTRPENRAMVHSLRIPMQKLAPAHLEDSPTVATVDAQPSFFHPNGSLRFDIVVDHHPLSDLGEHRFADVRPTYGSTATIFTEYFFFTGRKMSRRLATALFYGLKTDTNNLTRKVHDADVEAFRYLRGRVDENVLRQIELSQMPVSVLDAFSAALARKRIHRDVAFTYLGLRRNPDEAVYVVDLLITVSGISWAIVACRTEEKIVVLFRTDGLRKHAGKLAEEVFGPYGTAGGHRTMARAELYWDKLGAELSPLSDGAVERWLLSRLAVKLRPLARALDRP